jgi:amidohydrolase
MTTTSAPYFAGVRPGVLAILDDAIAIRRDLHAHPELSWQEERTQGVVLERLRAFGLEDARPMARTGATALVRGGSAGPALLWRADMDALPVQEETGAEYASQTADVMHACGHDGHVAIALTLALALHERRSKLRGSVRFAFQPAEERENGARTMIDEGVLAEPEIEAAFGLHINADADTGRVLVAPGPIFASPTGFRLIIRGKPGHAANPHQTVDPILVAAQVIVALQTIVSRSVDPQQAVVVTVGKIEGGVKGNVISREVKMSGTIRTFDERTLDRVIERFEELVAGVCAGFGAEFQFDHTTGAPPVVNDAAMADLVSEVAGGMLGAGAVAPHTTTGGDDMAFYLKAVPGCYFFLGARNRDKGLRGPHHQSRFDFDEDALAVGVEMGLRIIERYTGSELG